MKPGRNRGAFGRRALLAALIATSLWLPARAARAADEPAPASEVEPAAQPHDSGTEPAPPGERTAAPEPGETQDAPASQARRARALAMLTRGNELMALRDFDAALAHYRRAYALYPSEKLLLNIGTSLLQLGRLAEAAETYERYERDPRAAPHRIAELRRILADIDRRTGRLTIAARVPGAHVSLDGRALAGFPTPATVRVDPGPHRVLIELPDRSAVAGIVTVGPGERRSVRLTDRSLHGARVAHRTAASVLGTVGVAGIALGAVFGAMAIWSVTQQQSEHSPTLDRATAEYAAVAGGGLGAGAALLGTAVIVAVTTPEGQAGLEVSATGCPGIPRGLGLRLRW